MKPVYVKDIQVSMLIITQKLWDHVRISKYKNIFSKGDTPNCL